MQALRPDGGLRPVIAREFSRAERLLVRFDVYRPATDPPKATATLLNRGGDKMAGPAGDPRVGGRHASPRVAQHHPGGARSDSAPPERRPPKCCIESGRRRRRVCIAFGRLLRSHSGGLRVRLYRSPPLKAAPHVSRGHAAHPRDVAERARWRRCRRRSASPTLYFIDVCSTSSNASTIFCSRRVFTSLSSQK